MSDWTAGSDDAFDDAFDPREENPLFFSAWRLTYTQQRNASVPSVSQSDDTHYQIIALVNKQNCYSWYY